MTNLILDIPHITQLQGKHSGITEWERKICGLACIKMCMDFFCGRSPDLETLLEYRDKELIGLSLRDGTEKRYPYYLPGIGWFHYGLVMIATAARLHGRPLMIPKDGTASTFSESFQKNIAVIASVSLGFEQKEKNGGHLVVVRGIESDRYVINDPMNEGTIELAIEDFEKCFSGAIILIGGHDTEEFRSNKPIFIDSIMNSDTKNTYIHLHENEEIASLVTEDFLRSNEGILLRLHQNKERFIRFEILDQYGNKIFLRMDPNRIFDDANLEKTLSERNNHMDGSLLPIAVEKGAFIRSYILNKINGCDPKNIIGVHTNKLLDINSFVEQTPFVHINHSMRPDSFIQATNKYDFDRLKLADINCVYFGKPENDGSLSDYCLREGIRYFSIESGEDDEDSFRLLIGSLKKVL